MNQIVTIVLPVFGLIGIGYVVAWARLLPEGSDRALADFCFVIALPLLIFRVIATADFSAGSPVAVWGAYYAGFAIVWTLGTVAGAPPVRPRCAHRRGRRHLVGLSQH